MIRRTYCQILDEAGATDEISAKVIAEALKATKTISRITGTEATPGTSDSVVQVPDHPVRLKAVEQVHRIRGRFQDKLKVDMGGEITHKTDDELLSEIQSLTNVLKTAQKQERNARSRSGGPGRGL